MSLEKNRPHRMPQDRRSAARQWFSYPRIYRFFDYSDTLLALVSFPTNSSSSFGRLKYLWFRRTVSMAAPVKTAHNLA